MKKTLRKKNFSDWRDAPVRRRGAEWTDGVLHSFPRLPLLVRA